MKELYNEVSSAFPLLSLIYLRTQQTTSRTEECETSFYSLVITDIVSHIQTVTPYPCALY